MFCLHVADTIERIGGLVRFLISFAVLSMASYGWAQNVVHYTTTNANVKYLFATAEPVAHLKSGDILDTNTLDCFGNGIRKPGDTLEHGQGRQSAGRSFLCRRGGTRRHACREDS